MKSVVLVGAGHVHRVLGARAGRLRAAGIALHLVAPSSFWYGGAVTAFLAGQVNAAAMRTGLRAWCRDRDIQLHRDRAIGLDARHRRLWLAGGRVLDYDAVCLNVGNAPVVEPAIGVVRDSPRVWSGHSVRILARLRDALCADSGAGCQTRIAIAGAGTRAAEIALGLSLLQAGSGQSITLYVPGLQLLRGAPAGVRRRLLGRLAERGVEIVWQTEIGRVDQHMLVSVDGRCFAADHLIMANRSPAACLVHATGLPADHNGLHVDRRLHSTADDRVFAAGACRWLAGAAPALRPDSRREAAVLEQNLIARFSARPYRYYRGGRGLELLDLGDGRGMVWRRRFWLESAYGARLCAHRMRQWSC